MRIKVLTTFPDMIRPIVSQSILGRAMESGLLSVEAVDIREYALNKHRNTDDYPFGGGAGMVMLAQPIVSAFRAHTSPDFAGKRIYMSPKGAKFTQKKAEELAQLPELIFLCGHYEGIDQRAIDLCVDEELSIGDYVLTGGELAALVVIDAVARLIPGVLGSEESPVDESFSSGLLEYPHYTRPREFEGLEAPDVLLSGNHAEIQKWRREQAIRITLERRPEMLDGVEFNKKERAFLNTLLSEDMKGAF